MKEQMEYKKKQDKAISLPEKFCSIIIDGAGASAFGQHHFVTKSKHERDRALKARLKGLVELKKPAYFYLYTMTEDHEMAAKGIAEV